MVVLLVSWLDCSLIRLIAAMKCWNTWNFKFVSLSRVSFKVKQNSFCACIYSSLLFFFFSSEGSSIILQLCFVCLFVWLCIHRKKNVENVFVFLSIKLQEREETQLENKVIVILNSWNFMIIRAVFFFLKFRAMVVVIVVNLTQK